MSIEKNIFLSGCDPKVIENARTALRSKELNVSVDNLLSNEILFAGSHAFDREHTVPIVFSHLGFYSEAQNTKLPMQTNPRARTFFHPFVVAIPEMDKVSVTLSQHFMKGSIVDDLVFEKVNRGLDIGDKHRLQVSGRFSFYKSRIIVCEMEDRIGFIVAFDYEKLIIRENAFDDLGIPIGFKEDKLTVITGGTKEIV